MYVKKLDVTAGRSNTPPFSFYPDELRGMKAKRPNAGLDEGISSNCLDYSRFYIVTPGKALPRLDFWRIGNITGFYDVGQVQPVTPHK